MIETIIPNDLDVVQYVVGTIVALFGVARMHASPRWWCPDAAWFWWPLRRYVWPPVDHLLAGIPFLYTKTTVYEREIVTAGVDMTLEELHDRLADLGYEAQPLASVAVLETTGDLERSSLAVYSGPKPFGLTDLPEWLRRYQTHVRAFGDDGDLVVTAHHEHNPWSPIHALPHLLGIGLDADRGVDIVTSQLDIAGKDES